MNYTVIGCGRVGAELAYRLFQRGHQVTIIDQASKAFNNLPPDFLGRTLEGEALDQSVLRRANIEQADGVAVVTNSDSTNVVVAHAVRSAFNIQNIIARNYDPAWRPMFEAFNLQVVSSSSWGAQRVEELLYNTQMRTVFSAGNGEVEIYEFTIPKAWAGHTLGEIITGSECSPVGLTRAGRAILPSCETALDENDVVLVSATFDGIKALRSQLDSEKEA
ncbi:MAG TPA: TrkA family potassium uptake protein [Anaerolineales bacterium]|nr:TrkA family potassium uptake protein [Anaerolineales bacterium]